MKVLGQCEIAAGQVIGVEGFPFVRVATSEHRHKRITIAQDVVGDLGTSNVSKSAD